MQGGETLQVLGLEVGVQTEDVVQGHLGTGVASPVEWGALLVVDEVNVHTLQLSEEVQGHGLVSLGCNVQY